MGVRTREVRGGQERWLQKAHRVRQEVATLAWFPVRKSRGSLGEHQQLSLAFWPRYTAENCSKIEDS